MWFRLRYLTHRVTWPIDYVITWFFKKALSPPSLGQWPSILATCYLSWVDRNNRVTWLIYHVITLYSLKGSSLVSQRQWLSNFVGLWVRLKEPHLLFQVNCRSSDCALLEKVMYPLTQGYRTQLEISNIKKLINQKLFFVIQKILSFDSYRYTPL